MRNLTISRKLIIGFGIVLFLMLVSVGVSFLSISTMTDKLDSYGIYTVPNMDTTWNMRKDMASVQRYLLRLLVVKDPAALKVELENTTKTAQAVHDNLKVYEANQRNSDQEEVINMVRTQLNDAAGIRGQFTSLIAEGTEESLNQARDIFLTQYAPLLDKVEVTLANMNETEHSLAQQQKAEGSAAANLAWWLLAIVAVVSFLLTIVVLSIIRNSILQPVKEIEGVYAEMAKGNMQVQVSYDSRDELGSMARSIRKTNTMLASYISDISEKLNQMSRGDMQVNVDMDYIGDFSAIKQAIRNTASSLNETLQTINTAAEQVSTGSAQVASGAQALATGSTEQASSVEELSVSVSKIAEQAAENSTNVKIATQYVEQAGAGVNAGNEHMKQLTEAMANIGNASNQITNITKVIEDIAFQTNILALNAAIEAARAGNAGKGFAVVADEVRNLAAKSAEAAKQTAELIQRSTATVSEGTEIAEKTARILHEVEEKANMANESIVKIDRASNEQAIAIDQIKQGLNQVSAVVQTNAATAEENSATSEEMSAQAATLREEVSKFKLDSGSGKDSLTSISLFKEIPEIKKSSSKTSSSLGKY